MSGKGSGNLGEFVDIFKKKGAISDISITIRPTCPSSSMSCEEGGEASQLISRHSRLFARFLGDDDDDDDDEEDNMGDDPDPIPQLSFSITKIFLLLYRPAERVLFQEPIDQYLYHTVHTVYLMRRDEKAVIIID